MLINPDNTLGVVIFLRVGFPILVRVYGLGYNING